MTDSQIFACIQEYCYKCTRENINFDDNDQPLRSRLSFLLDFYDYNFKNIVVIIDMKNKKLYDITAIASIYDKYPYIKQTSLYSIINNTTPDDRAETLSILLNK
jgi:hypothetical protein